MKDGGVRDVWAWTGAVGRGPRRTPVRSGVNIKVLA